MLNKTQRTRASEHGVLWPTTTHTKGEPGRASWRLDFQVAKSTLRPEPSEKSCMFMMNIQELTQSV